MTWIRTALVAASIVFAACGGCDDSTAGDGTNATTNGASNGSTNTPFETNESGEVLCGDSACACDDGVDSDGDGLIDLHDPECTGPYDDDEGTFATGIPGDNKDDCQDCFFDGNSGHGDDGCQYATECLLGGNPMGSSGCKNCDVADECYDFCRPRTPNGCDCFGCCQVTLEDGSTETVVLGEGCSLDNLSACETGCVINEECSNTCGRCELCLGKEAADLPADCYDSGDMDAGTPAHTCDDGETPCNDTSDCPNNYYCQLGCCIEIIL
jgi:hypothetical protein